ncbi:TetR/AcrR family transcriptional regulator [Kineococcus rhizosphaerae]|nr:TetR/AcrR family transcriptional regulator [Kineococcus rhizosphaerae]
MGKVTGGPAGGKGVPGTRRYDGTKRAEQAAATRRRIVEAAAELFAGNGFAGTTMPAIAERAGVSVETVTVHGPKRALLLAAFGQTFVGVETGGRVTDHEPWASLLRADPPALLTGLAELVVAGQERGIGMWRAVNAAAVTDDGVRELTLDLARRRRADLLAATEVLAGRGLLRPGRSVQQHADTLALLAGFDPYQLYVVEFGWTHQELREWFADTVSRLVLTPAGAAVPGRRTPTAGG